MRAIARCVCYIPVVFVQAVCAQPIDYEGIDQAVSTISDVQPPPDPELAVGPDYVIQVVNRFIRVTNKTNGALVAESPLDEFFGEPGEQFQDPRILYDPRVDRFVVAAFRFSARQRVAVAVSPIATPVPLTTGSPLVPSWSINSVDGQYDSSDTTCAGSTVLVTDFTRMGQGNTFWTISAFAVGANSTADNVLFFVRKIPVIGPGGVELFPIIGRLFSSTFPDGGGTVGCVPFSAGRNTIAPAENSLSPLAYYVGVDTDVFPGGGGCDEGSIDSLTLYAVQNPGLSPTKYFTRVQVPCFPVIV